MKKALIIIPVLVSAFFSAWLFFGTRPLDSASKKRILVKIETGESVASIADQLKNGELIRSAAAFKIYARFSGAAAHLRAGAFLLSPSQSVSDILNVLRSGKSQQISVTIPEGFTVSDIDHLLASKGLGKEGDIVDCAIRCDFSTFDFLGSPSPLGQPERTRSVRAGGGVRGGGIGSSLEGYLFPDTYYVDVADYLPKFFLERMLGTFRKRIADPYADEAKKKGTSLSDLVIMASLIEEESRAGSERPVVAGILWKRLQNKIALGVDATIRYALQKPSEALTKSDLETVSLYNTRHTRGLPPTPISNPGESAFLAALRPEKSEYWYYLHDSDGRIHYAVTNDEHNSNRAKYLR